MLEHGKISSRQAALLMISLVLPTSLISFPALSIGIAKQDAWLSAVIAIPALLFIIRVIVSLGRRFPGQTIFEYPELILGKIPGKVVAFLYSLWFLHIEILVAGQFLNWNLYSLLPDTPKVVPGILAPLLAAYIAYKGLEVLNRVNELLLPVVLTSFIGFLILSAQEMDITQLLPVYDQGMVPILKGSLIGLAGMGEIVGLAAIIPYLTQPREAQRAANLSLLVIGAFSVINTIYVLAVFGPTQAAISLAPTYQAIRLIFVANFLERLDLIFVIIFTLMGLVKISILRYYEALGFAQCFGLRDYRQLVLPLAVIQAAGALLMYDSGYKLLEFVSKTLPLYFLTFQFLLPPLLLIIAMARGMRDKPNASPR